jgi:hypothetical protein
MAVLGFGAFLLLLFLLGCTLAVIVAVGFAVAHGRFALAAVIGGGSVAFVIVASILVGLFATIFSFNSRVVVNEPSVFKTAIENAPPAQFDVTGLPEINASLHYGSQPRWRISLIPAIFLIAAVAFLLARFAKHHFAHAAAGHARAWPILLVIALLAFLLLGGLRSKVEYTRAVAQNNVAVEQNNRIAAEQSAEINAKFRAQAEALSKQQQDLAKRVAELTKNIQQRIDHTDIHQLMDEFDAPRIVLQAPFASMPSPAALLVAAAPSAFDSFQKSANALTSSSATQSTEHSQSKSKKKTGTKPFALASAKKNEQTPAVPEPPSPPAAPAPSAIPAVAAIPTIDLSSLLAESPSDDAIDLNTPESMPPAGAWHVQSPAAGKPAWVNNPPKRTGDIRREVVATEPYATAEECYRAADIHLMLKAYDRLQELEGNPYPYPTSSDSETLPISFRGNKIMFGGQTLWNGTNWNDYRLFQLISMGIDPDFLRREIVAKDSKNNESCEYIETVPSSAGPMKKLYVQIEFTPAIDRMLTQRWDAFHRTARFKGVGLGAFAVFGLLSITWGLLKADTATRGYYTKWLFIGVPIAIIGVTALSLLALVGLRG